LPDTDDYYEILGVARDADSQTIKKAYRRAAIKFHPDKNPGDDAAEARFKQASEAAAVLCDAEKRQLYDQYGKAGLGGRPSAGFNQDIFADFSDILGDLFGFGGRRGGRGQVGNDLRYDLEIDFKEAVLGLETTIKVPRSVACEACQGAGAAAKDMQTCSGCAGKGQVAFRQGFFTLARTCGQCGGNGKRIITPCSTCEGQGRVHSETSVELRIPAGVDDGVRMRMAGYGEGGTGGAPPGDLYVVLHVREHDFFIRDDSDVHCTIPISFSQAALGAELLIATIRDEERLTIPAGTQSGTSFRLKGEGAPSLNRGRHGDQVVRVQVHTPSRLNTEQKDLLKALAEFEVDDDEAEGLFNRVKKIFS
jgi:molecular chaperone DnaJ